MKIATFRPATDGWVRISHDGLILKTQSEPILALHGTTGEYDYWGTREDLGLNNMIRLRYGAIKNWRNCKWRVTAGEIFGIRVIDGHAEIVRFKNSNSE